MNYGDFIPDAYLTPEFYLNNEVSVGFLEYMDDNLPNPDFHQIAATKNGHALKYIALHLRTYELSLLAVKMAGLAIRDVPQRFRTNEMYLESVKQDGNALQYVPKPDRTPEICLEAVKNDRRAYRYIPDYIETSEIYLEALKDKTSYSEDAARFFSSIPEKFRTPEIYLQTKNIFGSSWFKKIPIGERTIELCTIALNLGDATLESVPKKLRTSDICLTAIKSHPESITKVPEQLRTPTFYLAAVTINDAALQYIPKEDRTPELIIAVDEKRAARANESNFDDLGRIPENLRSHEVCLEAVIKHPIALRLDYIDENILTEDFFLAAIKGNWDVVSYIPAHMRSPKFYLAALTQNDKIFRSIPASLLTQQIYVEAIKCDGSLLQKVPKDAVTTEMCIEYIKGKESYIDEDLIPEELRSQEIIQAVLLSGKKYSIDFSAKKFFSHSMPLNVKDFNFSKESIEKIEQLTVAQRMVFETKLKVAIFVNRKNINLNDGTAEATVGLDKLISESAEIKGWRQASKLISKDLVWPVFLAGQSGIEITSDYLKNPIHKTPHELRNINPTDGFQKGTYEQLCKAFDVNPYSTGTDGAKQYAAYITSQIFGRDVVAAERFIQDYQGRFYDLSIIHLPKINFNREKWAALVSEFPAAINFASKFGEIEEKFDCVATSLHDLKDKLNFLNYGDIAEKDMEAAKLCSRLNLSQDDFQKVIIASESPKRTANLPDIKLVGGFELDGYRLRLLEPGDARALVIGVSDLSNCCKHVGGAGASAAIHAYKDSNSGFYVVEDIKSGDLVAQSFAWLSEDKKTIVFDSIESKYSDSKNLSVTQALYKELSVELSKDGYQSIISSTYNGVTKEVANLMTLDSTDKVTVPSIASDCEYLDCRPANEAFSTNRIVQSEPLFRTHETQRVGRDIEKMPRTNVVEWDVARELRSFSASNNGDYKTTIQFRATDDKVLMHIESTANGKDYIAHETRAFDKHDGNAWTSIESLQDLVSKAVKMIDNRISMPIEEREKIILDVTQKIEFLKPKAQTADLDSTPKIEDAKVESQNVPFARSTPAAIRAAIKARESQGMSQGM